MTERGNDEASNGSVEISQVSPENGNKAQVKLSTQQAPPTKNLTKKKVKPRIPILQYHNDWVCVNKPAGMSVHSNGLRRRQQQLIVASLLKRQLSRKVWPVHRLDHRTSGALLFAFDAQVCGQLHTSLRDATAQKEYIALVRGNWTHLPETVMVNKRLKVNDVFKEAQTEFTCLATLTCIGDDSNTQEYNGACTLVKCRLLTGRKHQIRRHAQAMGHPILGDTQHGDSKVNRWWRQQRGLDRLFLHCLSLDLPPLSTSTVGNQVFNLEDDEYDDSDDSEDNKDNVDDNDCQADGKNDETNVISIPDSNDLEDNHDDNAQSIIEERIKILAPLSLELRTVLQRPELKELWDTASAKDPRLALEPYDERGGTLGSRRQRQSPATVNNNASEK